MNANKGKHAKSKKDTIKAKKYSRIEKNKEIKSNKSKSIKQKLIRIITSLFIIAFSIIIIATLIMIVVWVMNNKANQDILEEIENSDAIIYDENSDEINIDFNVLKEINPDVVGYLKVNNTDIEYPVVKGTDNEYYLKHNFKKEYNSAGWVFADYRNKFDGTDKNIIIYGHNMKNNSMFGTLKNVLNTDWCENVENKYVTFITEQENSLYEVFSVYQIEKEEYYIQTGFSDEESYEEFINTVTKRSIYDFNIDVTTDDNILTLSTCATNNKYRVVLHAKKVD